MRLRAGRGFSLDELKAAKVPRKQALSIGIPVDHRRKNRSQEGFQNNVARLKAYKSRLILFPLNPTAKRARAGDATKAEREKATQVKSVQDVLPIVNPKIRSKARVLTAREKNPNRSVVEVMHKARMDKRLKGQREKKAKEKKEGKMKKEKKAKAEEEVTGDE
jgi:large subunit ribosomal protein L13e